MSGEAVLNILNSTRFAEKFRDFSWEELNETFRVFVDVRCWQVNDVIDCRWNGDGMSDGNWVGRLYVYIDTGVEIF